MKFTDIVYLARQGFTPADIKELMALKEEPQKDPVQEPAEPVTPPVTEPEDQKPPAAAQSAGDDPEPEAEEIAKLQAQIKSLQEQNLRRERPQEPAPKSNQAILEEMARNFM